MSIEFFDHNPSLNDIMRDERNQRMASGWGGEAPFGKDRWKEDKIEPFDFNQLVSDFNSGDIDKARFASDLNSPHGDHIDLNITFPGADREKKYRIFDSEATQNLFDDIGPNWTGFGF